MIPDTIPKISSIWRHYKGGKYIVTAIASDAEDNGNQLMVVYRQVATDALWVRPLAKWLELIQFAGQAFPRFTLMHDVPDG